MRSGACQDPKDWKWGAYGAIVGNRTPPRWLSVEEVLVLFAESLGSDGARAYRQFVVAGSAGDAPRDGVAVGDAAFLRSVLPSVRPGPEFVVRDWGDGRPRLDELLRDGGSGRAIAIAYRRHGYTMSRIAAEIGCHPCTVSRRLKAYEAEMLECKI